MIGKELGHYKILSKLGEGGWGAVYAALDTHLNREVALKLLAPERAKDPKFRRRFQREAQTIASLRHPNIVTLYSAEEHDGQLFLTMERVEGHTLTEAITGEEFALDVFFERAISLADALRASHESGIVHRDVKPENIMIDRDGRVRVLDFGLAKLLAPADGDALVRQRDTTITVDAAAPVHTASGQILGTVTYMSPEQARGQSVDHRTDIFSLGAVMYEMATGQAVFHDATVPMILDAVLHRTPVAVNEANPAVPGALAEIIKKALEKNREARYQTAAELVADLERVRATVAPVATKKKRGLWIGLAIVGLGALAATVLPGLISRRDTIYEIKPLTTTVGLEVNPTWSPQGDRIAYSSTANGPLDIYIRTLAGETSTLRTESDADDLCPCWSPDDLGIVFISGRDTLASLYWMDAVAGDPRKLASMGIPCSEQLATAWQMLGAMPWNGPDVLFSKLDSGRLAIWKVNVQTGKQSPVTHPRHDEHDLQASWDPDGKRIVFHRRGTRDGLYIMEAPGEEPRPLLVDDFQCRSPVWSTDGAHVFFVSNRKGSMDLWRIDDDGDLESLRQLTHEAALFARWPTVSRDGRIAYSLMGHQTDLRTLDLSAPGARPKRVTTNTADNFGARFSPAHSGKIVFHSSMLMNHEIWLLERDADDRTSLTNLTRHGATDIYPDFSPSGKSIVFLSDRDGAFRLWMMNADGTKQTRVSAEIIPVKKEVHYVGRSEGPRWSPDGKAIGYLAPARRGRELRKIDPRDGTSTMVLPGPVYSFGWYRDSDHVIYVGAQAETEKLQLRVVNLRTGKQDLLRTDFCAEIAVSRDGSSMTFCRARSHFNMQLFQLDLQLDSTTGLPRPRGEPRLLDGGDGGSHIHNGDLSHDGKKAVYTFDVDSADLFMLDPTD